MGRSDALCGFVGRGRYQLILGFLPLICAISGNAALQSREVTIHAIVGNATSGVSQDWFIKEIITSACHGIVMGIALGFVAFFVSGLDITFGITILVVQLFSMISAGLTGTMLPFLYMSRFKQETGQWSMLLVTTFQDIVGSFASVVLSYYIIMFLSGKDVDPGDTCMINVKQ